MQLRNNMPCYPLPLFRHLTPPLLNDLTRCAYSLFSARRFSLKIKKDSIVAIFLFFLSNCFRSASQVSCAHQNKTQPSWPFHWHAELFWDQKQVYKCSPTCKSLASGRLHHPTATLFAVDAYYETHKQPTFRRSKCRQRLVRSVTRAAILCQESDYSQLWRKFYLLDL